MNIKLFGYSISLNVIILIGILYLIMVVNALSGSCNREGVRSLGPVLFTNKIKDLNSDILAARKSNAPPMTKLIIQAFNLRLKSLLPMVKKDAKLAEIYKSTANNINSLNALIKPSKTKSAQTKSAQKKSVIPVPLSSVSTPTPYVSTPAQYVSIPTEDLEAASYIQEAADLQAAADRQSVADIQEAAADLQAAAQKASAIQQAMALRDSADQQMSLALAASADADMRVAAANNLT
jgi:regulator of protease activity HflC (stomatin/prohibitin superfamily)